MLFISIFCWLFEKKKSKNARHVNEDKKKNENT